MARTELLDPKRQRSVPLWLFVLAALLLAGRLAVWRLESSGRTERFEQSMERIP